MTKESCQNADPASFEAKTVGAGKAGGSELVVLGQASSVSQERAAAAILMRYRRRKLIIRLAEMLLRPLTWFARTDEVPELDEVDRILFFEAANLGDVVTLAPFLRSLKARFPKAHLAFLGKPSTENSLRDQGLADEVISIRVPWAEHLVCARISPRVSFGLASRTALPSVSG